MTHLVKARQDPTPQTKSEAAGAGGSDFFLSLPPRSGSGSGSGTATSYAAEEGCFVNRGSTVSKKMEQNRAGFSVCFSLIAKCRRAHGRDRMFMEPVKEFSKCRYRVWEVWKSGGGKIVSM